MRSLEEEFSFALHHGISQEERDEISLKDRRVSIATGLAAYPLLCRLAEEVTSLFPRLHITVCPIENTFFGKEITVSGLLTGKDLSEQLVEKDLGETLFISRSALRSEGDLFLCGMSLSELEKRLGVPVIPVENDGGALLDGLLGL